MELSQTDLENFWTSILGAEESWCFCEEWCHVFLEKEIELHWMRRKEKFIFASWGWGKNDKWSQNVAGTRKLQPSASSIILLVKRKEQKQKHFWWVLWKPVKWSEICSVVSDCLWPHGLYIVHSIFQARILEVAFPFSRGSSQPRDQTQVSRNLNLFTPVSLDVVNKNGNSLCKYEAELRECQLPIRNGQLLSASDKD